MKNIFLTMLIAGSTMSAATSDPIAAARAIGGTGTVQVTSMALDRKGNVVVVGSTTVADIAAPAGGAASAGLGKTDGFIACMTPDLKTMLAFTYVGGADNDRVNGVAVAPNGEIWIAGTTSSTNLPVTSGKGGTGTGTTDDGFVLKYQSDLAKVTGGRYLAGAAADEALSISCMTSNQAVVCGRTKSDKGMPDPGGHDRTHNGGWDAFVALIDNNAADVQYFSFFGSTGDESFTTIAVDQEGSAVVAGTTTSNDIETFPKKTLVWVEDGGRDPYYGGGGEWKEVGNDAFDKDFNGGSNDALVCRFMADGSLKFATYLGGKGEDIPTAVLIDADNHPIVVGTTSSANFPVPDAATVTFGGKQDVFLFSIGPEGLSQRFGRLIGGDEIDAVSGAALMANGDVLMTGTSTSTDLVNIGVGSTRTSRGGVDGFVIRANSLDVKFLSLFGWSSDDMPSAIALDADGTVILAGSTLSDLPDGKRNGPMQSFLARRVFGQLDYRSPEGGTAVCTGTKLNVSWTTNDIATSATYNVELSGDNGATWSAVASDLKVKSYQWTVPAPPESGKLWLRVRSSQGHVSGVDKAFSVEGVPVFTTQPASGNYCIGATITLEPAVEGSANMTYQWQKDGNNIDGANSRTLTIESAEAAASGSYTVVASTSCASLTSQAAVVRVNGAPNISTQPQSTTVSLGSTITLSVEADGGELTYQWEKNGTPVANATSSKLVIASATAADAGTYRCAVTSACGSVTSASATVNVGPSSVDEDALGVLVTPHPVVDVMTLTFAQALSSDAQISITDVTGTMVAQTSASAGTSSTLVRMNLPAGLYVVSVDGISPVIRRTFIVR
ncbi:MAG: T9SS type A sorting domain-containing protein [Candidatus Kapabacteria bacterium]|nr:T9SS type A sorting domain-containing protein [Candidatus Kapabacteria bacterium]